MCISTVEFFDRKLDYEITVDRCSIKVKRSVREFRFYSIRVDLKI